jgi:hypothetical protein
VKENPMKNLTVTLIGALVGGAAFGQDLLQCVNPDVVKGLLFNGRAETQMSITSTLPEEMAGFTAPAGFVLVGTALRSPSAPAGGTVAFRTSADSETAYATMLEAFTADGWVVEAPQIPSRQIFVNDGVPDSVTVCRDSARRNLLVQDHNGRRYVTVNFSEQPNALACNAQDPRLARTVGMMSMITEEAPSLRLPEGTTNAEGGNRIASGGGGSGDTYTTGDQIRIAQSASSFLDDIRTQMLEQGWAADASWSGTLSKGARWTKTGANGFPYWATLELVDVGNGIHDLSFRLMMPPN